MHHRLVTALGLAILSFGTSAALMAQPTNSSPASSERPAYTGVNGEQFHCDPPFTEKPEMQKTRELLLTPDSGFNVDEMMKRMDKSTFQNFVKWQADLREKDWPYLCRYRDANQTLRKAGDHPDVVFMGDSITENWAAADPAFFTKGYVNRGISGQTTSQMLLRMYPDVVDLHPRLVHIMAGTNDVAGNTGALTEDEVIDNIRAMIDIAQANDVSVILASVPPVAALPLKDNFKPAPIVRSLNTRLHALAAERKITFIDYYDALTDESGGLRPNLTNDGVHPTRRGYAIMEPMARLTVTEAENKGR